MVSAPKMPRPSGTMDKPMRQMASGSRPRMDRPLKRISPLRTGRVPEIANIVVDLPAPLGPTIGNRLAFADSDADAAHRRKPAVMNGQVG